ncbi:cell division protein FtsZ [Skermanella pratensis]|uniref:cell division protein FtsZ n=1 Tax=Skermanella pratensis TaxID=2233999 RepID=UPI001301640D|nr:cell division protein FtsZ [Skermanella pratensis]
MINLSMPEIEVDLRPHITVFGVGGAGGNAVNNMIKSNLEGVEFVVANTDAQALKGALAEKRLQLGTTITRGLGAGSRPDVGRAAAEEQLAEIMGYLEGANMVFITAGMGGGTGTGAAPVIARAAREQGILTVGVVTKPFHFEGAHRMRLAETGINELQQFVDTLIIIPNQNLFRIANEKTTFADAFKMADDVLHSGVRGVTDLMVMPGLINLDFADIRSVMTEMGKAMMGTGEASGERRAIDAAEAAISNPLLDDVSMKGARGVLINITGGMDMTLFEVDEAANRIRDEVDPDANIIFGSTFDQDLDGRMRVSVVATGIEAEKIAHPRPATATNGLSVVSGGRKTVSPAPGPAGLVARADQARQPTDYHHTLVAAPLHPGAAQGHAGQGHPGQGGSQGYAPQVHAPQGHAAVGNTVRTFIPETQQYQHPEAAPSVYASPAEPAASPAPQQMEAQPAHHQSELTAQPRGREPERVSGPLRGQNQDGVFIAPRPADSGPRPQSQNLNTERYLAPTAALPEAAPKKRGSSLFERVTGLGRRIMEGSEPEQQARQAPQPPAPPVGIKQAPGGAPQAPRPASEPMDRPTKMSHAEEEMLDIPAFLRRQAN